MSNKLFKSLFAFAMVLGSALGFVSCETPEEPTQGGDPTVELSVATLNFASAEGSQAVDVTSNSKWEVEVVNDAGWVTIAPMSGKNNGKFTVSVALNDSGAVRSAEVMVYALHDKYGRFDSQKLTISQSADEKPTVDEEILYSDNFDGKEATKEYGNSNDSWPDIDQFPEFANQEGPASENVTYSGASVSVRANSTSNSSYSDYAGSGSNNIFFGGGATFVINNIAPLKEGHNHYKLTFGTEKYSQSGDSTFRNEEFIVSLSKDGEKWAPVEYTYAGTEPGRWNVATANFTLTTLPEALYIKFEAKVASVYRLDDVKFYIGNGGQSIDLDNIVVVEPEKPTTDALYYENFDGKGAAKNGEGYWPYIADFPEMVNAVGPAAATVNYTGYNTTVRNNSNSDGSFSDYAGSGVNNIFFGKNNAWFAINELTLESSQKNLTLTFGTEKYSTTLGSLFTPSEFLVSISGDGEKWSNVEYTFAGTTEGRWNVATANFTLAEVPAKLYIKFTATAESAYRLDDVTLDLGEEGSQVINLDNGTTGEPSNPDQPEDPTESLEALTNDAYYIFKPATEINGGKWYAIVSENHAATALTKNYGYLSVVDGIERTNGIALPASCAFGFLTTTNGYIIQQYDNKYIYQTGTYNSFNVSDTLPADGGVWTVTVDGDKFTITNNSVNKFVQYDTQYGSYGSYSDARGNVPTLYELVEIDNSAMIVSVSSDSLQFAANGGTDAVEVVTNGDATLAATSNVDWVTASVSGNVVNVTVDANDAAEARDAIVTVTYGESSKVIAVSQVAAGDFNEYVITFPGNPTKYTNNYTSSFSISLDGASFTFSGINNGEEKNAWTAVRFGRKSDASVATIVTDNAIPYAVSSVKINFTQVDTEMNSAKLIVAKDNAFSDIVEEVTATLAVGEVVYPVKNPAENLYYKLEYDMPSTGTNGTYRFDKLTYAK